MALMIAGERSGAGKTTVTLALLAFLRDPDRRVQSFKVGPDYIDPMFHHYVTRRPCRNLDPVLTSETYVQRCFVEHSQTANYALVEGVMGLFDGASGGDDWASTAHIARLLDLPILLVLDCARLARSVAAIAHGYRSFDPRLTFAGVVLNRVGSDRHLELLKSALEPLNLPVLGVFRRYEDVEIPSRHLGLVPTEELSELEGVIHQLAQLGKQGFDWEALLPLLTSEGRLRAPTLFSISPPSPPLRLAIARDRAFSFYYADNLDLLERLGVEIVFWSPMQDALPDGVHGLYLGGGFPEVFAANLAENQLAREQVGAAIRAGMPTYAECGGLMYLCQGISDFEGTTWPMVGVLPTTAQMGKRLTLGYRRAIALQDGPVLAAGEEVWGHEFHRSTLSQRPDLPLYELRGYDPQSVAGPEGWLRHSVHASYVHLHWGDRPEIPLRFLQHCDRFRAAKNLKL